MFGLKTRPPVGVPARAPLLPQSDKDFIRDCLPAVTGWLDPGAPEMTAYLMNFQAAQGIKGPAFEIGVFEGKYLMLLHHLARAQGGRSVGVDVFQYAAPETVINHAKAFFGTDAGLTVHKADSKDLTPRSALKLLGGRRPRIISVDGDHSGLGVERDLWLASQVIADRGILAIDDIGNPNAMGVAEGAYRFFLSRKCRYAPFVWVANKTFACHQRDYEFYRSAALEFAKDCPELPTARNFVQARTEGSEAIDQIVLGRRVLMFA